MKVKIGNGLLPLNLLVIVLIVAIIFTLPDLLRVIVGLPFLLFFPGHVLLLVLFSRKEGLGGIERVALSFGISIAIVPLIGLILNYTWWGITLESTLYSIAFFIFVMALIAWVKRMRLLEEERFSIEFQLRMPGWGGGTWGRVLSVLLAVAIMGALGTLGYVIATPKVGERFTEFYILGVDGKAAGYPTELATGQEGKVIVGIINREHEPVIYNVKVMIDGVKNSEVGRIELEHDEKWEGVVAFTPDITGDNEKVEFLLYKNEEAKPSLESLHLWVDVT